jgi:hypothetical protein
MCALYANELYLDWPLKFSEEEKALLLNIHLSILSLEQQLESENQCLPNLIMVNEYVELQIA